MVRSGRLQALADFGRRDVTKVRRKGGVARARVQQGDPVIAANRGFSYETLPMMTAVVAASADAPFGAG